MRATDNCIANIFLYYMHPGTKHGNKPWKYSNCFIFLLDAYNASPTGHHFTLLLYECFKLHIVINHLRQSNTINLVTSCMQQFTTRNHFPLLVVTNHAKHSNIIHIFYWLHATVHRLSFCRLRGGELCMAASNRFNFFTFSAISFTINCYTCHFITEQCGAGACDDRSVGLELLLSGSF